MVERVKQFVILNWNNGEKVALANDMQTTSDDKSKAPMLWALAMTSAASQLEADWRWYSLVICNLNTKIIVNTKWKLINDSKYYLNTN